jgi:hypothetical protein
MFRHLRRRKAKAALVLKYETSILRGRVRPSPFLVRPLKCARSKLVSGVEHKIPCTRLNLKILMRAQEASH